MTVKEYFDLLLENDLVEYKPDYPPDNPSFKFTPKALELIHQKYPEYSNYWFNAGNYMSFWSKMIKTEDLLNNWRKWDWYTVRDTAEMNFMLNLFNIDNDDSYIDLDDIIM